MVQTTSKTLTLAEFASEYANGQIIPKNIPQGKRSAIQGELVSAINGLVKPKHIAQSFPKLRCTFGGHSIVPDIAVFGWNNTFTIAPDWTIEILSPNQELEVLDEPDQIIPVSLFAGEPRLTIKDLPT